MALRKLLNLENDPLVKVVFYFLVIRNETLDKHYPGGVIDFHERHGGVIGYYVSIISWMGPYWDDTVEDLSLYGLNQDRDWILEEEQLTEGLDSTPTKAFEVEMSVG